MDRCGDCPTGKRERSRSWWCTWWLWTWSRKGKEGRASQTLAKSAD